MKKEQALPVFNILIIGANGGIGRQTLELALKAGHHVTAILRNPAKLSIKHPNLEIVQGDIMKPETFEKYLDNKEVIVSAIGVNGGFMGDKPTTLYSLGNKNLLETMKKKGAERVFFISASAIEISPLLPAFAKFMTKYLVQKLLKHMYADLRIMEKIVRESDSSWTIIRPPRLTNKPVTGQYRIAINQFLSNCLNISRPDVAHFIINNITNDAIRQSTVEIAY
jgi:putative NADH-flavin reductase